MQKSSIARKHRGGVSTSKVLQGFEPISHCGRCLINKIKNYGIIKARHCDERSEEAIHKNTFKCVPAGTSKRKGKVFSWIASLPLAMTPSVILVYVT